VTAAVTAGWCVFASWRYPASLRRLGLTRSLLRELRPLPADERLRVLAEEERLWPTELALRVADTHSSPERLAVAGEQLADLEHIFVSRARQPAICAWLALAVHLLCSFAGHLAGVGRQLLWLLPMAVVSAAACHAAGREARRLVVKKREIAETLVAALIEDIIDEPMPERRQMRWRRRRRI
jgi:hypothetical protein